MRENNRKSKGIDMKISIEQAVKLIKKEVIHVMKYHYELGFTGEIIPNDKLNEFREFSQKAYLTGRKHRASYQNMINNELEKIIRVKYNEQI